MRCNFIMNREKNPREFQVDAQKYVFSRRFLVNRTRKKISQRDSYVDCSFSLRGEKRKAYMNADEAGDIMLKQSTHGNRYSVSFVIKY